MDVTKQRKSEVAMLHGKRVSGKFLEISDDENKISLNGGDQKYFGKSENRQGIRRTDRGSCGVIAVSNIFSYFDKDEETNLTRGRLLPPKSYSEQGSISHESYMQMAQEIYDDYLTPFDVNKMKILYFGGVRITIDSLIKRILGAMRLIGKIDEKKRLELSNYFSFGIWPMSRLEKGAQKYAKSKNIELKLRKTQNDDLDKENSFEKACNFIEHALNRNEPVAILLSHNPAARKGGKIVDRHYMVITKIEKIFEITESQENGKPVKHEKNLVDANIDVASWGREYTINFKEIWQDSVFHEISEKMKGNVLTRSLGNWINKNMCSVYLTAFKI